MNYNELQNFYQGKKIFITGHTGFKGAWLAMMLKKLGAEIYGYALAPEDKRGNFFKQITLDKQFAESTIADIRDQETFGKAVKAADPNLIFHLAAQPFVLRSYQDPLDTISSNVIGSTNLYEIVRNNPGQIQTIVNITSDKCYENLEIDYAYKETDAFGGYDPYSASKGMCEILTNSYRRSFFNELNISLVSCRAGNVVGGGDFGENRIIPDLVEMTAKKQILEMRKPQAIRPWQHVFDVLYGYLIAGAKATNSKEFSCGFNFAPDHSQEINVETLIKYLIKELGKGEYKITALPGDPHEAHYLKLDASKARQELGWDNKLNFVELCSYTASWYQTFIDQDDLNAISHEQLESYFELL